MKIHEDWIYGGCLIFVLVFILMALGPSTGVG